MTLNQFWLGFPMPKSLSVLPRCLGKLSNYLLLSLMGFVNKVFFKWHYFCDFVCLCEKQKKYWHFKVKGKSIFASAMLIHKKKF